MSKLIQCKTCGAEISDNAKACPHCGEKTSPNILLRLISLVAKIFGGIFVLLVILIIISPSKSSNTSTSTDSETKKTVNANRQDNKQEKKENFEIISGPEAERDSFGIVTIKGTVKNTSGKDLNYAQITFALYDDSEAQVGTAVANINNLEKDGLWKYSATPMTMESWSKYKMLEFDCW